MASHLRIPTLAIAALSLGLNIAIIGCAGRTLNVYLTQRHDNVYFLPVWASHFDMRGLPALLGTSAVIVVLNSLLVAAIFISAVSTILKKVSIDGSVLIPNKASSQSPRLCLFTPQHDLGYHCHILFSCS